jgi:ribosomal protein S18 acetylase RimI-like enzyme
VKSRELTGATCKRDAVVALNVFGGNEAARGLYRSLGYTEDAVSMSKPV